MKIGVIREIKDRENRVALTPDGAGSLIAAGHQVLVEENAGIHSGFTNQEYESKGAVIVATALAWKADLVLKVKEPLEPEYPYLSDNLLFTYLHLAGVPKALTSALLRAGTTAIAYETVEDKFGKLILLAPMSAIAGNMAATVGAWYLARFNDGKGVQTGRILGDRHGKVMVLGNGIAGQHAAVTADGMGANVFIFGRDRMKFQQIEKTISSNMQFVLSTPENIDEHIRDADLVVGAVLLAGAKAPWLVTEEMVKRMQPGSVIVDISIDQGGCIETSRVTSHSDPVFVRHGVIHYCVSNMPGAYPRTSTIALTNATLPYVLQLANREKAVFREDGGFARGVNTCKGFVTCKAVAEALDLGDVYRNLDEL